MEVYNAMPEHPTLSDYQQLFTLYIKGHHSDCPLMKGNKPRHLCHSPFAGERSEVETPEHVCSPIRVLMALMLAVFEKSFEQHGCGYYAHTRLYHQRVFLKITFNGVIYITYDGMAQGLVRTYDINPVTRYIFYLLFNVEPNNNEDIGYMTRYYALYQHTLNQMHDIGFLKEYPDTLAGSLRVFNQRLCMYCHRQKSRSIHVDEDTDQKIYEEPHRDTHYSFYYCVLGVLLNQWRGSRTSGKSKFDWTQIRLVSDSYLRYGGIDCPYPARNIFSQLLGHLNLHFTDIPVSDSDDESDSDDDY